jgi:hypothetical protein
VSLALLFLALLRTCYIVDFIRNMAPTLPVFGAKAGGGPQMAAGTSRDNSSKTLDIA